MSCISTSCSPELFPVPETAPALRLRSQRRTTAWHHGGPVRRARELQDHCGIRPQAHLFLSVRAKGSMRNVARLTGKRGHRERHPPHGQHWTCPVEDNWYECACWQVWLNPGDDPMSCKWCSVHPHQATVPERSPEPVAQAESTAAATTALTIA